MTVYVVVIAVEDERPQVYGVYTKYDDAYKAEKAIKHIGSYFCEEDFIVSITQKKVDCNS